MVNGFISGDENGLEIKKILSCDNIRCAVAFWGMDIANEIIKSSSNIKIICNLRSGACNPSAIEKLIKNGTQIKTNDDLHAKVYISDDLVIVGSANASSNGLGYEDSEISGWIEASIVTSNHEVNEKASSWFENLWDCSSLVNEAMLEDAKQLWSRKRASRLSRNKIKLTKLSQILASELSEFKDTDQYIAIWKEHLSLAAVTELKKFEDESHNNNLTCYEDWEGLLNRPEGLVICDFYIGPRHGVTFNGVYKTIKPSSKSNCVFGKNVEKNNLLLNLINNDKKSWCDGIKKLESSKNIGNYRDDRDGSLFIPVFEALLLLKNGS
jgi:Phosphatidylserine/phosphatidylglycerophosphate/cardiolipin synthases and related enzymes